MRYLTPDEVQSLASLIRDGHLRLAVMLFGVESIAPAELRRLRDAGLLADADVQRAGRYGTIGGAYNTGAAMAANPETADRATPPEPPRADAPPPPPGDETPGGMVPDDRLPDWQQRYAETARRHGAQMVVGLGNRTADRVAGEAFEVDLEQEAELRRRTAETIAEGIEAGASAGTIQSKLGDALGDDWTRDLGRIVMTETQAAVNAGYRHAVLDEVGDGAQVAVIPDAGACALCRRVYLDGGKPRIFDAAKLPPSSVNYGVKAAEKVAAVPPMHPWCACQLVYVEPGWQFNEDWQLLPPGVD